MWGQPGLLGMLGEEKFQTRSMQRRASLRSCRLNAAGSGLLPTTTSGAVIPSKSHAALQDRSSSEVALAAFCGATAGTPVERALAFPEVFEHRSSPGPSGQEQSLPQQQEAGIDWIAARTSAQAGRASGGTPSISTHTSR